MHRRRIITRTSETFGVSVLEIPEYGGFNVDYIKKTVFLRLMYK